MSRKKHVIIYTVDIHGSKKLYKTLLNKAVQENVNSIVIGGDILPKSSTNNLINIQKNFIKTKLIPVFKNFKKENPSITTYLMMGNDDFKISMPLLEGGERRGYFKLLDMKVHKLNNQFNICGYSHVPPLPFLMKDWQKHDTKKTKELSIKCDKKFRELIMCKDKQRKKLEGEYLLLLSKLGYTHNIHYYTDEGILSVKENDKTTIEDDLKSLAKKTNPKKTVFVIHSPPWNTKLDRVYPDGAHIGSKAVRGFIEREQPVLTLHGHAHESFEISGQFNEVIGKTISINPGSEYDKDKLNAVIFDVYNLKHIRHIKVEG
ncbi:MAG: metallophosphoesterase [Candidatus Thermoplasmatota archaeon]|nr:metallophosphoesterase [Candidatus Thermoplasmatota archaeon]